MFITSSDTRRHRKVYRKRRRYRERLNTEPFSRRMALLLEHAGKRLFAGIVGWLIAPRKVAAPLNPAQLQRILLIRNDAIGDMILTTPFWRVLKQHHPHLQIGVVGSFRNLPVIAQDPDVQYRFECNGTRLTELWKTARAVRNYKWDVVLPMIYNKKTKMALLAKLFAPRALSSMVLLAEDPTDRYEQYFSICVRTSVRMRPEDGPMLDLMRRHLEGTFRIHIPEHEWRPSLWMDEQRVGATRDMINSTLRSDGSSNYFHINLEAKMEFKEFGLTNSYNLSLHLLEKYPCHSVLWTASPTIASKISGHLGAQDAARIHFIPTDSLDALTAVIRGADVVISPDTSVIHFASAEQRPVVGLYPYLHEWPPYKVPHRVLTPEYGKPVSTIPVEEVFEAVQTVLNEPILTPERS